LLTTEKNVSRAQELVGKPSVYIVTESGGKYLLTNQELPPA